ncbi:ubiquitin carboxyl-terminal hydrolase MINDY-1-like isoform X2 [Physella acuta]|uniref:ubiquitin carboxyl-terminal hydrolase MINDY-1-like isoform X2 n=1 Tax=Physella acuta TaxID=109671 RepID=UPI0027DD939A|nr:ubiquitin carboxyl-terminal hydrolase MINDY-1-like isoform X2 [Physella acuta]
MDEAKADSVPLTGSTTVTEVSAASPTVQDDVRPSNSLDSDTLSDKNRNTSAEVHSSPVLAEKQITPDFPQSEPFPILSESSRLGKSMEPNLSLKLTDNAQPLEHVNVGSSLDQVKKTVVESSAADFDSRNSSSTAEPNLSTEFENLSVTSSPNSSSNSGQDSGVSQDEFSQETASYQSVIEKDSSSFTEPIPKVSESPSNSPAKLSPDANTSASETQVTVSDLDSPAADGTTGEASASNSDQESVYYIKWISFGQASVPIITQNENGPCPLLAIMNVLLLKGKVKLAPMLEMVTSEQLMTYLGECIFENMPQNLSEISQANYEQNMQDAMGVMYKLQTGLDVNVKFSGVADFEYTPELIIFDLLEISLFHGWLVDPQDSDTVRAVNQDSYNQLVEKIISLKQSEKEENVRQALIAEQFLERSASQLTYHGLCELSTVVKEKELCVFFRNNHFSTLYKNNNELFQLVTDQGFLTESNVVWETLSTVDGDCHFTDATFRTYTKPAAPTDPITDPSVPVGSPEQIDQDYQVALFLQEEASSSLNPDWGVGFPQETQVYSQTDHDLAMRLQAEEDRKAEQHRQAAAAQTAQSHAQQAEAQRRRSDRGGDRREKDEKSCLIL